MVIAMKIQILENQNITSNSKQIAVLKQHFPNCFDKDGKFLPEKMAEIADAEGLDLAREGYSLNWLGKSYARLLANLNTETLLSANKEHNQKDENKNSENLLIQGDNLDVLKHLKNAYAEQIKMIYIDPPYNTGGDGFVYADDRKFSVDELAQLAGIDEHEAKRILDFTQSNSNSHSAWLTFMYPRLYIAKELMSVDGVIFISIDDNEQAQLKMLCDEVFGEESFVSQISVVNNLKGRNDKANVATAHEHVIIYSKSDFISNGVPLTEDQLASYKYEDKNGEKYALRDLRKRGRPDRREDRPNMYFPIYFNEKTKAMSLERLADDDIEITPLRGDKSDGRWRWGRETVGKNLDILHAKYSKKKDRWDLQHRVYLNLNYSHEPDDEEVDDNDIEFIRTSKPKSFWIGSELSTDVANREQKSIFKDSYFDYVKPTGFIEKLLHMGMSNDDIVLDFFAGSGTTAHAVMALNAQEPFGKRKSIAVQLDEPTDPKSKARKRGYKTIFEITRERIMRAAKAIKTAIPEADCDFGFKEFKTVPVFDGYLDEADTPDQFSIFEGDKLTKEQREQLLLTWQVFDGLPLNLDLAAVELDGYTAHAGNHILYFVNSALELKHVVAMLERIDTDADFAPQKIVIFEYVLSSKAKREITEAIKGYNNRKQIELHLEVRF